MESIAKIRGQARRFFKENSIIIEFFLAGRRILYETNTWLDLFVISRPQLRGCFASGTLLAVSMISPFRPRFCSFSGIWPASRWCKNLASRISSCRVEGFARPLRSTSSSTCGTRFYERSLLIFENIDNLYTRIDPLLKISP